MSTQAPKPPGSTAPLWVWAVVILLLLLIFISYKRYIELYVEGFSLVGPEFVSVNAERLQNFSSDHGADARPRVVSIGTSLMKYATYPGADSAHEETGSAGRTGISLLNISQPGGLFDDFVPLMDQLVEIKPDILLVHSELLLGERVRGETQGVVRLLIKRWWGGVEWGGPDPVARQKMFQDNRTCKDEQSDMDARRARMRRDIFARPVVLPSSFIGMAEQLGKRGIRVVVLHLPREISFRQYYVGELREWQSSLHASLQALGEIPLWSPPGDWGVDYYCDYRHLNERGRDKLMGWLVPRLQHIYGRTEQS